MREAADEALSISGKRFFREEVQLYGIRAATLNQMTKRYWTEIRGSGKETVLALCEELWQSGMQEEALVACRWSERLGPQLDRDDFLTMERWIISYVTNWATCDTFCNHTVGDLIMKYPQLVGELKRWSASTDRWVRRAAAVSLIIPARRGLFLSEVLEIAGLMMSDPDDMVQKGYGWMLKAASEAHPDEIFRFLMTHKTVMPRTAFRYALEKMPAEMRRKAMGR